MGMGFAPTLLRQVSPRFTWHDHFKHCHSVPQICGLHAYTCACTVSETKFALWSN